MAVKALDNKEVTLVIMKRITLISVVLLASLSLSACRNNTKQSISSSDSSKESSLRAANASLKHKISQQKEKQSATKNIEATSNLNSSVVNSSSSNQEVSNTPTSSTTAQPKHNNTINSPEEAVAAAKAKYGDNNGDYMWGAMGYDNSTYQYPDGSYFVKAISRQQLSNGSMTGTAKSVMVQPDGTITEN